jgi:peptidoglycan/LPS O-acetylase OafA/YrhL
LRFAALDGWRGIAAVGVAVFHLSVLGHFFDVSFVRKADVFVDFFFVLSGFVLTHAYGDRLSSKEEFFRFAIRRLGRLWPLHAVMTLVLVATEVLKFATMKFAGLGAGAPAFAGRAGIDALAYNVFLLHGLGFIPDFTWNLPSWSISTEFYVYVAFASVCVWFGRPSAPIAGGAAVLAALMFYTLIAGHVGAPPLYAAVPRCICEFFIGVLVYRLFRLVSPSVLRGISWFEVPLVVLMIGLVSVASRSQLSLLTPVLFGLTVFVFAPGGGMVSRVLECRPLQDIGEISYSIYLVHFVVLTIFNAFTRVAEQLLHVPLRAQFVYAGAPFDVLVVGGPWVLDLVALGYLVVVIGISRCTYRLIEVPARDFFNRLAGNVFAGRPSALSATSDTAWHAARSVKSRAAARGGS